MGASLPRLVLLVAQLEPLWAQDCLVQAPAGGDLGDCPQALASGSSCRPSCREGYESGAASCSQGLLSLPACTPLGCNVSQALQPQQGLGSCPELLASGEACELACGGSSKPSGNASCLLGNLSQVECVCPAGYEANLAADAEQCLPCPLDSFKSVDGPGPCESCPENSNTNATARTSRQQCQCPAVFYPERNALDELVSEMKAMNLLSHFGCITSGMPLETKIRAQATVSGYLAETEEHTLSFDRFLCVVQDLRMLGMEEKAEVVHAYFTQYDRDQLGELTIKEICQILMDLKIQPKSLSEQEAMAQLIEEADSGSGKLSVEDLLLLVQRIMERIGELKRQELIRMAEALGFSKKQASDLWETFEALDVSQDGLMDIGEVGQAISLMKWPMSLQKLQRHVDELDSDGNGQLDFIEFCQLLRKGLDDVAPKKKDVTEPRELWSEDEPTTPPSPVRRGRGAITQSSPLAPKRR